MGFVKKNGGCVKKNWVCGEEWVGDEESGSV